MRHGLLVEHPAAANVAYPSLLDVIFPRLNLSTGKQFVPVQLVDKSVFNLHGFVLVWVPAPQVALHALHALYELAASDVFPKFLTVDLFPTASSAIAHP